jgi:hypothetical protein
MERSVIKISKSLKFIAMICCGVSLKGYSAAEKPKPRVLTWEHGITVSRLSQWLERIGVEGRIPPEFRDWKRPSKGCTEYFSDGSISPGYIIHHPAANRDGAPHIRPYPKAITVNFHPGANFDQSKRGLFNLFVSFAFDEGGQTLFEPLFRTSCEFGLFSEYGTTLLALIDCRIRDLRDAHGRGQRIDKIQKDSYWQEIDLGEFTPLIPYIKLLLMQNAYDRSFNTVRHAFFPGQLVDLDGTDNRTYGTEELRLGMEAICPSGVRPDVWEKYRLDCALMASKKYWNIAQALASYAERLGCPTDPIRLFQFAFSSPLGEQVVRGLHPRLFDLFVTVKKLVNSDRGATMPDLVPMLFNEKQVMEALNNITDPFWRDNGAVGRLTADDFLQKSHLWQRRRYRENSDIDSLMCDLTGIVGGGEFVRYQDRVYFETENEHPIVPFGMSFGPGEMFKKDRYGVECQKFRFKVDSTEESYRYICQHVLATLQGLARTGDRLAICLLVDVYRRAGQIDAAVDVLDMSGDPMFRAIAAQFANQNGRENRARRIRAQLSGLPDTVYAVVPAERRGSPIESLSERLGQNPPDSLMTEAAGGSVPALAALLSVDGEWAKYETSPDRMLAEKPSFRALAAMLSPDHDGPVSEGSGDGTLGFPHLKNEIMPVVNDLLSDAGGKIPTVVVKTSGNPLGNIYGPLVEAARKALIARELPPTAVGERPSRQSPISPVPQFRKRANSDS